MRRFKLLCIQEEIDEKVISGMWYNRMPQYGTVGQKMLFMNGAIQNGTPANQEEYAKVMKISLTIPEANGRTATLPDGKTHYYSNLKQIFECEDFDVNTVNVNDWNAKLASASTPQEMKEKILKQATVFMLQRHSEVDFPGNKNLMFPLFKLIDITASEQMEVDTEMAYLDLVDKLRPIFKEDPLAIKDLCYGYGMSADIKKHQSDTTGNGLFIALLAVVRRNPVAFETYFSNHADKVTFYKAVEFNVIGRNGSNYTFQDEPIGTEPEDAIDWLKLHPTRYETLRSMVFQQDGRPAPSAKRVEVVNPDNTTVVFDKAEIVKACPFQSTAKNAAKKLRAKYGTPELSQQLEETFREICSTKKWQYDEVFGQV